MQILVINFLSFITNIILIFSIRKTLIFIQSQKLYKKLFPNSKRL